MTSDDQPNRQSISLDASGAPVASERIRLLLVDDVPAIRQMVTSKLDPAKYRCFEAEDGAEALTVLEKQDVDIVVTDVMMPVIGGFELLRRISEDSRWSEIPVIMLSAMPSDAGSDLHMRQSLREQCYPRKVNLVVKPFNFRELQVAIDQVLQTGT